MKPTGLKHVANAKLKLYTDMRPGHLYLQQYGHPSGPSWGMCLRGTGRPSLITSSAN